ncbi:MAG: transcriptional regulator [Phormidesmis priestleyi]|uniref:Transcriptional regulator n=1 Tax=Phormidesmis priestleyi TaxID=268141 RepID=A0A2W4XSK8_9CYAN|nr:MAG: transcriptional regulator [Phormidesmis priestleyi]
MNVVKRLEIIVSSRELPLILEKLDQSGVRGYSVIRDVIGKGDGGKVSDDFDFVSTTLSNVYILSFCDEEKTSCILEKIRPLLQKFGGACYISDSVEVL